MTKNKQVDVAVITGQKAHDVIGFHQLFGDYAGINPYIQHIDDFASTPEQVRDQYDVVLFFFMMRDGPTDDGLPGYCGRPKSALEHLGQTEQGIVVLHHALLAYPQWSVWDEIVGIPDRTLSKFAHDEKVMINITEHAHPITHGLSDWAMVDETYLMADAVGDNHILLKTNHEQSMKTIAWARTYKAKRVFCLQSGHGSQTWEDKNFKTVLERGILWTCGRL